MAVFRIERTRDYTVMSNHHLRNGKLSLKAKGLLSMMLSLPEDWNYTTRGLAAICKEGVDAIGGALRELETAGYIVRHQLRDRQGRISDTEYVIYEQPQPKNPDTPQPDTASPDTENPDMVKPDTEKPAELNIEKSNTEKTITYGSSTDSIPFREPAAAQLPERKGRDAMSVSEMENYRDLILENIEYDHLCREFTTYREDLDEIVELMVETVCAKRKTTRIAGSDFPHEVVRSRFLKLDCSHIEFVMECLRNNTLRYKKRTILHQIALSAAKGEVIGVVGHNGAGKTTFSRALCGLHKDCEGAFLWDDQPMEHKARLKRSYMVMQDVNYELFAESVEAECSFGIRNPDQDLVEETMKELGLTAYRERHPNTLSGGQKQRVAVAVSMICGKDLLVFDEPTSGLDFDSMAQVAGLIKRLSEQGKIIFIVTHDFEFVCRTCSRVLHFDEGEMPDDIPVVMDSLQKLRELFSVSERKEM